jgi:hypothetical protein
MIQRYVCLGEDVKGCVGWGGTVQKIDMTHAWAQSRTVHIPITH